MGKSADEKLQDIDQKIHRLQAEKKRLKKQKENNERKKRDHAMIVVGTTIMTHYSDEIKEKIINASDDEIKAWVHSLYKRNSTGNGA